MKKLYCRAALLIASLATPLATVAADSAYPHKPISLVVGYPVGGGTDIFARLLAEKLAPRLGQPVVVVNRPGATGIISASHVSRSPADGYTLLLTPGSLPYAQMVLDSDPNNGGYDPLNGFTPVALLATVPIFLVSGAQSEFKTAQQVIQAARADKISYATAGTGSIHHMIGEVVSHATGAKMEPVPYKGVAPAVNDVLGGHIPLMYTSLDAVLPYLPSGKLRILATSDGERSPFSPDTPTFRELGYDVDVKTWYGMFGPKGMPADIVRKLNENLNEILAMPDIAKRMAATLGAAPVQGPPEVLGKVNAEDYARFGKIIKDLNIKAQ